MMSKEDLRISVIGLGKLGTCLAAIFAYKGYQTLGVDISAAPVEAICRGTAPVVEPGVQELITASGARLAATQDWERAIAESDVSFLMVPTPSRDDGDFSDQHLRAASEKLALAFKRRPKPYHCFVVTSTVSPGTTEGSLIPLIENLSARKLGVDFGVCYNPQFVALGSVIRDSLRPDLVLIGESDARAGAMVEQIQHDVCDNQPYIARMSIVSAEIAKLSLNSYVTMKISFANTLARICERVPGADIDAITAALGSDRRISPQCLKGGLSFGGPCFPRDNRAMSGFAQRIGWEATLAQATDTINRCNTEAIVQRILEHAAPKRQAAVLGLAYKPNTPVIEESPAIHIIERLLKHDVKVMVYDPLAMENVQALFGSAISYAGSIRECIARASISLIACPWEEFRKLEELAHDTLTIIDCWRLLNPAALPAGVKYIAIGRHS